MGWFDRFKTKSQSSVLHTIQLIGNNAEYFQDKDKAVVKKGYFVNGDVYAISSRIARNAANIPRQLFERKSDGSLELVTDGDLFELITKRTNQQQTAIEFRQEAITWLLTRGNSFVYGRTIPGFGDVFKELINLHNDNIVINCGIKNFRPTPLKYTHNLQGYEYKFDPEEIIQTKYFNPSQAGFDSCLGLSPLEAGMLSLIFSTDTKKAQAALIKTQGGRGFLTNRSERALSPEDKAAIQKAQDMRIEGAEKFNKLIATSANIDFVSTAMDANQLKTIESSVLSKRDLCDLYGVDSSLFNDPANKTYSNRTEAEKAMFTNAVIPVNEMDILSWNTRVVPAYAKRDNKNYIIKQDLSHLPILHKEETEKSKKALNESKIIIDILSSSISDSAKILSLQRTLGLSKEDAQQYLSNE